MCADNKNSNHSIEKAVNLVKDITDAVPVYPDLIQPAAKELGKSLQTVAKLVNVALAPVTALIWGYDKIGDFLSKRLAEKLENVAEGNIITPSAQVAGPAIESLKYVGEDENLRELYANLIASAMNKEVADKAHPAYVEILKNLSSTEALLLKAFIKRSSYPLIDLDINVNHEGTVGDFSLYSNYSIFHKDLGLPFDNINKCIDNLCRLGLTQIPKGQILTSPNAYLEIEKSVFLDFPKAAFLQLGEGLKLKTNRKLIEITIFGKDFLQTVVDENYKSTKSIIE